MANGAFPVAASGFAPGFRRGFNMMDQAINRNRRTMLQRQQVELEEEKALRNQLEKTRSTLSSSKEEALKKAQEVIQNASSREQAEQAIKPIRRAYKGLVMQEAMLGSQLASLSESLGEGRPEGMPAPREKVGRELEVFDSIVNNTLTGREQIQREGEKAFTTEFQTQRARSFFDDPAGSGNLSELQVGKDDLAIMTSAARDFGTGSLPQQDEDKFLSATQNFLNDTKTIRDPDTGLMITVRPELPPQIRQQLDARGVEITDDRRLVMSDSGEPAVRPGAGGDSEQQSGGQPQGGSPGAATDVQGEGDFSLGPQVAGEDEQPETTIAEEALKGNLTGFSPALKRVAARFGFDAPEQTTALNAFNTAKRQLVTSLQQTDQLSQRERESIEQALDLEPGIIDSKTRFFNALVGVDETLQRNLQSLRQNLESEAGQMSVQERRRAMDTIQRIEAFRRQALPPVFTEDDQDELVSFLEQAEPGTRFIFDPEDGEPMIRRIR